jgi:magnesium chelatase accessory protein
VRFHVQVAGDGPALLLLHGAAGSTHSWARILPRLAQSFRVVAPDLPGHAFSSALPPERSGPAELTTAVARLLDAVAIQPTGIVAHSAGAAVAVCLFEDGAVKPARCAFLAPSLSRPPRTGPAFLQGLMAPLLRTDRVAELAALLGRSFITKALLDSTGSRVPAESASIYRLLTGNPAHIGAVLRLLSQWDPEGVEALLPGFSVPTLVLAGAEDGWIPRSTVERVASELPEAELRVLEDLGHLAHEEAPDRVLGELLPWLEDH